VRKTEIKVWQIVLGHWIGWRRGVVGKRVSAETKLLYAGPG